MSDPRPSTELWRVCCSNVYKAEIVFFSQISFLMTILLFSIVQIINKADNPEIYFSIISTVLGIVIPQPRLNEIDNDRPRPNV